MIEVGDLRSIRPARRDPSRPRGRADAAGVRAAPFLARHAGEVVPRTELLEHVWDEHEEGSTNVVDVYVGYLRKKLERPFRRRP